MFYWDYTTCTEDVKWGGLLDHRHRGAGRPLPRPVVPGRERHAREDVRAGLRPALAPRYVIFYRIKPGAIEVVRVLDERRHNEFGN